MSADHHAGDRVVVIGGGFGGLAAALRLAAAGRPVTLLERAATIGGKARRLAVGTRAVEAGPTVFTMKPVFDALFAAAGSRLEDAITLRPARVLARHAWPCGSRFDLFADLEETVAAVDRLAGPAEADRYRRFAADTEAAWELFRPAFVEATRPTPLDVLARIGLSGIPGLIRARPSATLWRVLSTKLHDPRLRQLFGRYATYCGSDPFAAPATLMLIAHVERLGVWTVEGGMTALARAIADLAERHGTEIRTSAEVARIETTAGRISGVELTSGDRIATQAVVFNGDAGALPAGLLGPDVTHAVRAVKPAARSYSALVWSAVAEPTGFPLSHHTVFFGPDYAAEFEAMNAGRLPPDPTTYICAMDRDADASAAPSGPERLHIQINAPATGDAAAPGTGTGPHPPGEEEIEQCRIETEALMARAGLRLSLSPATSRLSRPQDYEALFPGTGGALYGEATRGPFASFRRAPTHTRIPGLFLAGGSAHPGAGVPMATLSGRLAAEAVTAHLGSTPRSRPVAISGGMSTPSRTTGSTA
ncbi:MAG: 1-hydroxycarotenoid 3,4-desaturase CrtD [Pseudomonadota bacterium]